MSIIGVIFSIVILIANYKTFDPSNIAVIIMLNIICLSIDLGFTRLEKK